MVSERKQNANQQNAKNSTGPGDTGTTRFNALKHGMLAGFLSNEAIISGGPRKEDPEELEALRDAFFDYWAPEGLPEEQLVDQLVMLTWRWRRIVRHEANAIHDSQDRAFAQGRGVLHGKQMDEDDANATAEKSEEPGGFTYIALVKRADELVEAEQRRTQLGKGVTNAPDDPGFLEVPERASGRPSLGSQPEEAMERQQLIPSLPSAKVLEKIQRYESHTSRLYDRALRQLVALQAVRRQRSEPGPDNWSRRPRSDGGGSARRPRRIAGTAP